MSIQTVYASKQGKNYKLSEHFTLEEFQSKDGADKVLYDTELMAMLEKLRSYVGGTVHINSGYRSKAHNKAVGGASNSYHTKGIAADIVVKKDGEPISGKVICCLCQSLGFKGVGFIKSKDGYAVHVDMRSSGSYRGDERYGYGNNVPGGDFYKYFGISKSQVEALKADVPDTDDGKKEEEEMTQEQFNQMMEKWISDQAAKEPSDWSKEARQWAEENGIIQGTGAGFSYRSNCTREQLISFLYRFYKLIMGKVGK